MGAGASIPDVLDANAAKVAAGDAWDAEKFDLMKDGQGLVTKAAFLAAADDLMADEDMFDLSSEDDDDSSLAPETALRRSSIGTAPAVSAAALEAVKARQEQEKTQAVEAALEQERKKAEQEKTEALAAQAAAMAANSEDAEKATADAVAAAQAEKEEALKKLHEAEEASKNAAVEETRKAEQAKANEAAAKAREEALEEAKRHAQEELAKAVEEAKAQAARDLAEQMRTLREEAQRSQQEALDKAKSEVAAEVSAQAEAQLQEQLEAAKKDLTAAAEAKVAEAEAQRDEFKQLYTVENQQRRGLHNKLMDIMGNIRVICRIRPVLSTDKASGNEDMDIVTKFPSDQQLVVRKEDNKEVLFEFDNVFGLASTQSDVFNAVQPMVVSAMDGYKVCIFAYGQTGSGKTFTMEGPPDNPGVTLRALQSVLDMRAERTDDWDYTLTMSMLEIYNETVRDLLSAPVKKGEASMGREGKGLEIRQAKEGSYVEGLNEITVETMEQISDLMAKGNSHRAVGVHDMNAHSSRSHSIICIRMPCTNCHNGKKFAGKLHLIDLAGSERVGKTGCSGERLKEAQNINKSLSALGDVIAALGAKAKKGQKQHVPFRNSKLTFLLQDSLGGQSKVLMFANASPCLYNAPETVCSLQFAARCRNVSLGQSKKATAK